MAGAGGAFSQIGGTVAVRSPKHGLTLTYRKGVAAGWVKKINKRSQWVCSAAVAPTPAAADAFYERNFTDLWQPPPPDAADVVTVEQLADLFIDRKSRKLAAGEIHKRTFDEERTAIEEFCDVRAPGLPTVGDTPVADLSPAQFGAFRDALGKRFGPDRLAKYIIQVRGMFRWAGKPPLRMAPPDYADEFDLPTKATFRLARRESRAEHGRKLFEPAEIRKLVAAANPVLRAMILLALNGGYGNTDVATLPLSVIDYGANVIDYARGKTGIDRRVPLWPRTVAALRTAIKVRPKSATTDFAGLVFLTRYGQPYVRDAEGESGDVNHKDQVSIQFRQLCERVRVGRKPIYRPGRSFYSLRRTFRTLADETGDQRAADLIMGHATDADMGGVYVQEIGDERLVRVVTHVHDRLFSGPTSAKAGAKTKATTRRRGRDDDGDARAVPAADSGRPAARREGTTRRSGRSTATRARASRR